MELNVRESHVDRFLEVMAAAEIFGKNISYVLLNAPNGYPVFGTREYPPAPDTKYKISCSKCLPVNKVLSTLEPVGAIRERVAGYKYVETKELDNASKELLACVAKKLGFTTDNVVDCIELAEVIASMEGSEIRVNHIAEARQYINVVEDGDI
jgi:hypothetical protein